METLDSIGIYNLKNAKNQTKTHKMEILEELESEPLELHSRGPGFESLCAHRSLTTR